MRFAALKDLSEAETKVETIRSKLQAVSEKIVYTGIIRSQMARGGADGASIHIVRGSDTDATTVSADSNTLLSPGDTIEVALHTEAPVPAPGQ
jgi:polysaccharide export outer membrane protein